ncbi:MAG: type VI secretion system ATPase TssH, partial [Bacteroidales bacterium]|nr:type VI secretion system ATPase TssH [Bacteroidales bacterium]
VIDVLKASVRPEFLNRIDEIVMFEPLSEENIREILRMQMAQLTHRLSEDGVTLSFTKAFEDYMAVRGYDPAYGARPVKRMLQRELVNQLATAVLDGSVKKDSDIEVDAVDDKVVIRNRS